MTLVTEHLQAAFVPAEGLALLRHGRTYAVPLG